MKPPIYRSALLLLALACATRPGIAAEWQLALRAGDHERSTAIVRFAAPPALRGPAQLESADRAPLPVQLDDAGGATFLAPPLAKGATHRFVLKSVEKAPAGISTEVSGDVLKVSAGGQQIFSYQMAPGPVPEGVLPIFRHGAHLHPVFSPGGRLVTADHPADHRWHRGIWLAWTSTGFEGRKPDFWNLGKGEGAEKSGAMQTADVRFEALDFQWSGPVHGGFVSRHRFLDLTGAEATDVLHEIWDVTAYRLPGGDRPLHVIDLISTQACAGDSPLKLPKYHYGGLGVRGSERWNPVDAVSMLTSNGDDRVKGDGTKAKWLWLGGEVEGGSSGIAVLIHPANFRFPQPLRLNPKNPQICIAPSQEGDWAIAPGRPLVSRYRIVIADGPADAALLDRLWTDYAEPPMAELATP